LAVQGVALSSRRLHGPAVWRGSLGNLRDHAIHCRRLLLRLLLRHCFGFCFASVLYTKGLLDVLRRDLKVVLAGHLLGISHPGADDVRRELVLKFGLPGTSQVVKKAGPLLETGAFDDFLKCRAQVAVPPATLSHC